MAGLETHCKISKERTGNEFRELHLWIDEPWRILGCNHRIERHTFNEAYKNFIEQKWGKKAVTEWLFHIAIDNLETANKFAKLTYSRAFDKIEIAFNGKNISSCEFKKVHPNSTSIRKIDL